VGGRGGRLCPASLADSQPDPADPGLLVEARYVVDSGHPDAVVFLHVGDRRPGLMVAALDHLDDVVRRMTVAIGSQGPIEKRAVR